MIVEGVDGIPPLPPQPFLAKETAGAAASAAPPTPIIAGEQQVTSSVSTLFLVG